MMVIWRFVNLIILMSRIVPHPNSIAPYATQSAIKPQSDDDSLSVASHFSSSYSEISAFQSMASSQRINSLKPKLKISVSRRSTLATASKLQYQDRSAPSTPAISLPSLRNSKSIEYSSIKPLFNWNKLAYLCGGLSQGLGQQGCLCGLVCPWRQAWVQGSGRLDNRIFQSLLGESPSSQNLTQIQKDLARTHPECPTYANNIHFRQMLRKVLVAYSIYDLEMGYVQGVNMIAGVLLYHIKDQSLTFWALVGLMEEQELRQIYLGGLEHLQTHCLNIKTTIQQRVFDLHQHMQGIQIYPECFLNGWLLSLMSTAIPMGHMHLVLDNFRKSGWRYIYQLIVTYLLYLKEFLLASRDEAQFLMFLSAKSSRQLGLSWRQMIESASLLKI